MLQDVSALKRGVWFDTYYGNSPLWSLSYEWWFYVIFIPLGLCGRFAKNKYFIYALILSASGFLGHQYMPNQLCLYLGYFFIWWAGVELAKEYLSELNVSVMTAQPSLFALPLFHNQWFYIGIIGALIILAILSAIIIWYRRRKILSISPQAPSNSPTPVLSAQVPNIVTPAPVESPVASAAEPSKSIPLSQPKQSTPPTQTEENAR